MNLERYLRPAVAGCMVSLGLLAATPAAAQDTQLQARALAATCANCHGTNGHARGNMKALAGVPAERLLAQLADFKRGVPASTTIMHQIARGYSDEQLRLVAGYFAAQPAK